jgi:pilus assembly protein CpaC
LVTSLTSAINLAVTNGQAYILANPRLVTRSGQAASFLAGGEVPIPVAGALGTTSIDYKSYGVKLHIAPQVDAQGHILATIQTSLSQIDPSLSVQGYPAFLTRKTDAVVNVLPGQTIVLSGLIDSTGANDINKVPGLGDLPVLGALFRSTQFQRNQSELVIFVTPHILTPESARNTALIHQAQGYAARFDRDYRSGYYLPGVGRDIDAVPWPQFPKVGAGAASPAVAPAAPASAAAPAAP